MIVRHLSTLPRASDQIHIIIHCWLRSDPLSDLNIKFDNIDDQAWVKFSSIEKFAPTLAVAIETLGMTAYLPADLQQWLRLVRDANIKRNELILAEITQFTKILNEIDVQPCYLKGAAYLLDDLYGDIGLRFMADCDCLIPEDSIAEAHQHLLDHGYTLSANSTQNDDDAHLPTVFSPESDFAFELHRNLSYLPPLDRSLISAEMVLSEASIHDRDGIKYKLPSIKHRISHLLAHATLSPAQVLRSSLYIRDLIDLDMLLREASVHDMQRSIACFQASPIARIRTQAALHAAARLFKTPIEDFGSISLLGRLYGQIAIIQTKNNIGKIAGRFAGILAYLAGTIVQAPSSLPKTLSNITTQLAYDFDPRC